MKIDLEEKNNQDLNTKRNNTKLVLSIVIPSFNSKNLLLRCLEALEIQSTPKAKFEVIVTNDGSTDRTLEMLSKFQLNTNLNLKWTTIINSGPGIARNEGVNISSGSWIGFLDADVIPDPKWVENSFNLIFENPDVGAFEGLTKVSQVEKASPFSHQTENLDGGRYPTCNFVVRRSLAYFYPAYKIPFREDTDLAFSILKSGYEIVFAPELIVEHPPLPSDYFRPISLARRYYYDGLLSRRFPMLYKKELDAHRFIGIKVPHLKKKLYTFFAISQLLLLFAIINGFGNNILITSSFVYILGIIGTSISSLRHSNILKLSLKDWLVFLMLLHILPWIVSYSLIRGWYDFRREPEFSRR